MELTDDYSLEPAWKGGGLTCAPAGAVSVRRSSQTSAVHRKVGGRFVETMWVRDLSMLFPWYAATMLAMKSGGVIGLRLSRMAARGRDARREAELTVSEKVDALVEAAGSLCGGATAAMVIAGYRERVAAGAHRLAH